MSRVPITAWHVVASGFTQDESRWHGMVRLWRDMHARLSAAEDVVSLRTWNTNWRALAEHIFLVQQEQGDRIAIGIYAYSWGAAGAMRLARELDARGIPVMEMVCSDPIYRHPLWSFAWLSLTSWRRLVVPQNVRRVQWFYQRMNRPMSQGLVAADDTRTIIEKGVELIRQHQYCDDSKQFHEACHAAAEGLWSA